MKSIEMVGNEFHLKRSFTGLFDRTFKHEIKETKSELIYQGPKIPPEEWRKVLAFFKWTFTEHDSESQVRAWVNPTAGTWRFWAMKQEARTGMSAREIAVAETEEEARARFESWGFEPSDDWIAFGTVHHHCRAGAFQSGTDEQDEKDQEGLHITIGSMQKDHYDMHARFYVNKVKFHPVDMTLFWNIGAELEPIIPANVQDIVARHQMTIPSDSEFPEVWKTNVQPALKIEVKKSKKGKKNRQQFSFPGHFNQPWRDAMEKADDALVSLVEVCHQDKVTADDMDKVIEIAGDMRGIYWQIWLKCKYAECDPDDLKKAWTRLQFQASRDGFALKTMDEILDYLNPPELVDDKSTAPTNGNVGSFDPASNDHLFGMGYGCY